MTTYVRVRVSCVSLVRVHQRVGTFSSVSSFSAELQSKQDNLKCKKEHTKQKTTENENDNAHVNARRIPTACCQECDPRGQSHGEVARSQHKRIISSV